jgi:hypothetical protein
VFDNYAEYVDLHGDDRTIPEMDLPRISAARLVPATLKARLDGARAANAPSMRFRLTICN